MMKQILALVRCFYERCRHAVFANRIANHIATQHFIAIGQTLQGEAVELSAHYGMPIYDADFQEEIAE